MALLNVGNTLYLGATNYDLRLLSYTKDIHDFTDTDYWYAEFFIDESIKHLLNPNVLPLDIIEKMQRGSCILMLNNAHEAFHSVVKSIYDIAVFQLKIPPKQIVLISESALINKEVENIAKIYNCEKIRTEWMRLFEHGTSVISHNSIKTLDFKKYDKKFLSFNRRWRMHRPALVALLEISNLLEKGFVSLAHADDGKDWDVFYQELTHTLKHKPYFVQIFENYKERIKSIPELKLDQDDMTINHAHTLTDSTDYYYENSYFSIVSETNFFKELGEGLFTSEKIFRPILKQHPIIVLARPNTLSLLKEIGYQTFHPFINEDYDKEEDDCKRLLMIIEEINRLCSLNDHELISFLDNVKGIVNHNYKTLINKKEFLTLL